MTHAELLRKHAIEAENEGGVWFSGAYMNMMATMAESVEFENASLRGAVIGLGEENTKLRSMVKKVLVLIHDPTYEWLDATMADLFGKGFTEQARELGIEA